MVWRTTDIQLGNKYLFYCISLFRLSLPVILEITIYDEVIREKPWHLPLFLHVHVTLEREVAKALLRSITNKSIVSHRTFSRKRTSPYRLYTINLGALLEPEEYLL